MLEMLAGYGYGRGDKRVEKAIQFILREQEPDGSWFGRWGVNYIYGTFLVLRGLEAIGVDHLEPQIQQAAEWIRMVQNADGGWGETCGSYDDPNIRGVGISTPSQTAWALLGFWPRRRPLRLHRQGCALAAPAAASRRQLGRIAGEGKLRQGIITGTGFPESFTWLTRCTGILPAAGSDQLPPNDGTRRVWRWRLIPRWLFYLSGGNGCQLCAEEEARGRQALSLC